MIHDKNYYEEMSKDQKMLFFAAMVMFWERPELSGLDVEDRMDMVVSGFHEPSDPLTVQAIREIQEHLGDLTSEHMQWLEEWKIDCRRLHLFNHFIYGTDY